MVSAPDWSKKKIYRILEVKRDVESANGKSDGLATRASSFRATILLEVRGSI
jgi:hypothetical protein